VAEKWIASVLSCVVVAVLILYLLKIHYFLNQHRTIRRRIEQGLRVHVEGAYTKDALFPPEWNNPHVPFGFQLIGVVLPLIAVMVLVQAGTVFLIWKVLPIYIASHWSGLERLEIERRVEELSS
jgi:hypothetical protein